MDSQDKQKQPNKINIEGSNDSKLPTNVPPGEDPSNKLSKNPNPRANENLNSPGSDKDQLEKDAKNRAGSEITDGEDG